MCRSWRQNCTQGRCVTFPCLTGPYFILHLLADWLTDCLKWTLQLIGLLSLPKRCYFLHCLHLFKVRPLQFLLRPIYTPSTHYLHIIYTLSIQSTHYLQPNYNEYTDYLLAGAGDNNYSLACPPVRWQLSSHTTATDNILDSKVILPQDDWRYDGGYLLRVLK